MYLFSFTELLNKEKIALPGIFMKISNNPNFNKIDEFGLENRKKNTGAGSVVQAEKKAEAVINDVEGGLKTNYLNLQDKLAQSQKNLTTLQIFEQYLPKKSLSDLLDYINEKLSGDEAKSIQSAKLLQAESEPALNIALTSLINEEKMKIKALEIESENIMASQYTIQDVSNKPIREILKGLQETAHQPIQNASVLRLLES